MDEHLTSEQQHILKEKGTEPAWSGKYVHTKDDGTYVCAGCGNQLFSSKTKFDSGTGWPSFYEAVSDGAVKLVPDTSHGMERTEVTCGTCGGHLGHVFGDAPEQPTGQRYCINSAALNLEKEE